MALSRNDQLIDRENKMRKAGNIRVADNIQRQTVKQPNQGQVAPGSGMTAKSYLQDDINRPQDRMPTEKVIIDVGKNQNQGGVLTESEAVNNIDPYKVNKDLQQTYKNEGLDFDANLPGSFNEDAVDFLRQQKDQKSMLEKQLNDASMQAQRSFSQNKGALESQFSQGREGASSITNTMVGKEVTETKRKEMNQKLDAINQQKTQLQELQKQQQQQYLSSRADTIRNMERAVNQSEADLLKEQNQDRENTSTILNQLSTLSEKGILAGMTDEEMASLQEYLPNAPAGVIELFSRAATREQKNKDKVAVIESQEKSLGMLKDLVSQGVTMTPELLMNFSQQSGLPLESLFAFNTQAQMVMNDKAIDQETKKAELQKLGLELDREARGITNAELEKVDYLESMYKNGASPDEIARVKRVMGVKDEDDPMYQADLALKNAELSYKQTQTAETLANMRQAQLEYNALSGGDQSAYVPNSSNAGIESSYENGRLNITSDTPMQCGQFVSSFWGGGAMGDTIQTKTNAVNTRGIPISQVAGDTFTTTIRPGMAFVSEYGKTGHTGVVTAVYPDGSFDTMEANVGDNNPNIPDPPMPRNRNIKDADLVGFVYPPDGKFKVEGANPSQKRLTPDQIKLVNQISDDYNNNKQLGNMLDIKNGIDTVSSIYKDIPNASGLDDITAINALQRMIDPGATVREGDVALIQKAVPYFQRISPGFQWTKLTEGDVLPVEVRQNLLKVAKEVYREKATNYNNTVGKRFKDRSAAAGIPFELVGEVFELESEEPETKENPFVNFLKKFTGNADDQPDNDFASFDFTSGEDILNDF